MKNKLLIEDFSILVQNNGNNGAILFVLLLYVYIYSHWNNHGHMCVKIMVRIAMVQDWSYVTVLKTAFYNSIYGFIYKNVNKHYLFNACGFYEGNVV